MTPFRKKNKLVLESNLEQNLKQCTNMISSWIKAFLLCVLILGFAYVIYRNNIIFKRVRTEPGMTDNINVQQKEEPIVSNMESGKWVVAGKDVVDIGGGMVTLQMSEVQKANAEHQKKPWNLPFQNIPIYRNELSVNKPIVSYVTDQISNDVYPQEFLESQFREIYPDSKDKDIYIGSKHDTGVILGDDILKPRRGILYKNPAAFTPYAEDYVYKV